QQLVGMTDPHAIAAIQNQIAAIQTQMNQATVNPAWSPAGWNSAQVAFTAQIQALEQQLVGMTDPHAIAAVQNQIAAIQTQMNQATGNPVWSAAGWNSAQGAFTAQIQALQQQLVGMTDPNAIAAVQNQIAAIQTQMNQATGNPAWSAAGWNSAQGAFTAQIQALQQQLVGMTDPHAIAAVQNQIAAIQTQMNQGVAGWNGFAGMTANQQHNAALLAQMQAIQAQLVGMTDVNAQEALIRQVAAIQAQMV
ncbi:hypothetical protein HDU98_002405, partial [Podochytrium sp. JEL0797]